MLTIDIVAMVAAAVFLLGGIFLGFGATLKLLTGGLVGKIISVVVCYFLFGVVLALPFVQALLDKLVTALHENGSGICQVLLYIRLDLIVFAVALFFAVQLLRIWLVSLVKTIFEMDRKPMRILNKLLGALLGVVSFIIVSLIVLQILWWIGGDDGDFFYAIEGSAFGIDFVYKNNPLNSIFTTIYKAIAME